MKASEIMEELFSLAEHFLIEDTCDTCKAGNPDNEVTKVAVSMFATPDTVRQARDFGAQLFITHEPTYHNHMDHHSNDPIECEKRRLLEESGMAIYRYHDHPHCADPDMISTGMLRAMGLECVEEPTDVFDLLRLHFNTPVTPRQLAGLLEDRLGIAHIRIAGSADMPCNELSCMFGTPGGVFEELRNTACQILLTGEICEWALGEYARDAAQLGHKKAILVLGHIGSERDGMKYIAEVLNRRHPELEVKYIECDEVYTYSDTI